MTAASRRALRGTATGALLVAACVACRPGDDGEHATAAPGAVATPASAVVRDTSLARTLTQAEMIRAFQDSLPRPDSLQHAAPTREALIRRLVAAVARTDTAALRDLTISKAEFGYLYYPGSVMANPPYSLDPGTAWMLLIGESGEGLRELLRTAGRPASYRSHRCAPPKAEGTARIWRGCVVTLVEAGRPVERRLFHSVVELGGRFKLYSYGTQGSD